ncbi:hypothetical protein PHLGIDRAFT_415660, partial [Phlebiopsis gigantea 11061_1 CR5-6]
PNTTSPSLTRLVLLRLFCLALALGPVLHIFSVRLRLSGRARYGRQRGRSGDIHVRWLVRSVRRIHRSRLDVGQVVGFNMLALREVAGQERALHHCGHRCGRLLALGLPDRRLERGGHDNERRRLALDDLVLSAEQHRRVPDGHNDGRKGLAGLGARVEVMVLVRSGCSWARVYRENDGECRKDEEEAA